MSVPTLAQVTQAFRRKITRDAGLDSGTLRFDFGDSGSVFIDGNKKPNVIDNKHAKSDCTIYTTLEIVYSLILGQIDGVKAVQDGCLTIVGDVRLAMAFGPPEGDLPTTPFIETKPFIKSNLRFPFSKPRQKSKSRK